MSRELALCILVAVYDEIQTTQFNDVVQFGIWNPSSKNHLVEAENRRAKSYGFVTIVIGKMKMEPTGFEPVTSSMPLRRSTN